uniref:Oxysterol-binding protein n=1 Tax=Pygocentrus nattereri TaxID=42514 RepID=A0AAR2L5S8_PYGNA
MSSLDKSPISAFKPGHSRNNSSGSSSRHSRQNSRDWEVVTDLPPHVGAPGVFVEKNSIPGVCEGFLMKKRKYPLQGWHKRYFMLDKGVLRYAKTQQDLTRGKEHGFMDVSLAVMSVNKKSSRIDLDAGHNLYHLKVCRSQKFLGVDLCERCRLLNPVCVPQLPQYQSTASFCQPSILDTSSASSSQVNSKVSAWLQQSQEADSCQKGMDWRLFVGRYCDCYWYARCYSAHTCSGKLILDETDAVNPDYVNRLISPSQPQSPTETRSRLSLAESMAEYFDATEVIVSENLSENETSDESGLSDVTTSNSEPEEGHAALSRQYRASVSNAHDVPSAAPKETGRRTVLPGRCTDNSHIGILSILYNNIGKDLSRVSMPVALNEPLNFLQRVSEELEYPELLDIANHTDDPYQRMVYVAVFSISGYAWASWRNRYKPFNPVLGETYESVREDRGFRYVAEQVSHHPPVSACHAESENFTFWQDQRWKNKFWGKSVEIVSTGMVNVTLPRYGDHYEWNKAVTCIHSVFSQQRWLEHYGDVVIRNLKNDICTCKMTFLKSSKNEVQGVVLDKAGTVVHRFGGSWHEGIFCDTLPNPQCIWKPNVQPEDHYEYYGFSQYAREQNELTPELRPLLPPTDTRFRPDQRLLEEGKVAEADKRKDEVEEKQRERRKELAKRGEEHIPRFFRKTQDDAGREVWVSNGTYWKIRENPGFVLESRQN